MLRNATELQTREFVLPTQNTAVAVLIGDSRIICFSLKLNAIKISKALNITLYRHGYFVRVQSVYFY